MDGVRGDDIDGDAVGVVAPVSERAGANVVEDEIGPGGAAVVVVQSVSGLSKMIPAHQSDRGSLSKFLTGTLSGALSITPVLITHVIITTPTEG